MAKHLKLNFKIIFHFFGLLILFNGRDWYVRGWGLTDPAIAEVLERARRGLSVNWAHGLLAVITDLEVTAFQSDAKPPGSEQSSFYSFVYPVAGAAAVGAGLAIFWIIRRRQRLLRPEAR